MAAIIEKQRVAKRRKPSSFRHNNKSAGFNSGFMSRFAQKTAPAKKNPPFVLFALIERLVKTMHKSKIRQVQLRDREESLHVCVRERKSAGFSFPIPSLATLAVVAATIIIALAALNWEDFNIKTPEIYAFQPAVNTESELHIRQYAATGITSILPVIEMPVNESVLPEAAVEDDPHGSLVTFEWQNYKVKKGDSVSLIAQKFGISVGAIIASNEIRNARRLQEGVSLRIPNIDGIPYQIKTGDSLSRISASFSIPLDVILDINDIKSDNIRVGETIFIPGARMNDIDLRLSLGELFTYPLNSKVLTSHFGMRRDPKNGALSFHGGIDLRANTGTTVIAALDGVVSVVNENWLYGKYIIISHSNGYKTLYGHLNAYSVKQGDRVARGRKIGESGNTGYSTGPHLHFGIYDRNNRMINPLELLN